MFQTNVNNNKNFVIKVIYFHTICYRLFDMRAEATV